MARVTTTEVEEILDTDLIGSRITVCIETANNLVNEVCLGNGLSTTILKSIERWLSAHFCALVEPQVQSEKADEVSQTFTTKVGLKLDATTYGQNAMVLDISGSLRRLNEEGKATATLTFHSINAFE